MTLSNGAANFAACLAFIVLDDSLMRVHTNLLSIIVQYFLVNVSSSKLVALAIPEIFNEATCAMRDFDTLAYIR